MKILVEVSARHIHLSKEDLEILFGQDYNIKVLKQLSQPEEFAAEESVDIKINGKEFKNMRIVGPLRSESQIEISKTDAVACGVNPPVNLSGNLKNSLPVKLIGPRGEVDLDRGLIIAKRHIHCATNEATDLGLKNNDVVSVKIDGERGLIFDNVIVRIADDYKLAMHIDTDEGNAADINKNCQGEIINP